MDTPRVFSGLMPKRAMPATFSALARDFSRSRMSSHSMCYTVMGRRDRAFPPVRAAPPQAEAPSLRLTLRLSHDSPSGDPVEVGPNKRNHGLEVSLAVDRVAYPLPLRIVGVYDEVFSARRDVSEHAP